MSRVSARVGNRDIVNSGTVLFWAGEQVTIYPFLDDEEFFINFRVEMIDDLEVNTKMSIGDDYSTLITHYKPRKMPNVAGNMGLSIAIDEKYSYSFGFTVEALGSKDKPAIQLIYTISRVNRDV